MTRPLRSVGALLIPFLAVAGLSLATDQLFHTLGVYPPWGEPMFDAGDNLLALGYRLVFAVAGSWLAARLAPRAPMGHALALGGLGFIVSLAGAIVTISKYDLGPDWYPISLVVTALPCAWLGGVLHGRGAARG